MDTEQLFQFQALWANKADRQPAKDLAASLREAQPELFARFAGVAMDEMVTFVEGFRASGNDAARLAAEVYILTEWPPRQIGGDGRL